MKRKIALPICICVLLTLGLFFAVNIPSILTDRIIGYYANARAFPDVGVYYCDEIGLKIVFENEGTYLVYANGEQEVAHIDYGGWILGENSGIILFYNWIQDENIIEIEVSRGNNKLPAETVYYFLFCD